MISQIALISTCQKTRVMEAINKRKLAKRANTIRLFSTKFTLQCKNDAISNLLFKPSLNMSDLQIKSLSQ